MVTVERRNFELGLEIPTFDPDYIGCLLYTSRRETSTGDEEHKCRKDKYKKDNRYKR